ncbi:dephospho-CoA kinase [Clostridium rectalis]|uniref:dephospho-CoA kinase n=1 Tax=Clostridium rectalis TaxID=2040295 RepID=UPI001FAA2852|nr:dephospho-CoA kinase [Clostridium rectalis]
MVLNSSSMIKVGLTGGIGSGKSTVSRMLKKNGIKVIDADIIARKVFQIYPCITGEIKDTFDVNFFDGNNNLKRKEFGKYLFDSNIRRKKYEHIIIPYIKKEIFKEFYEYEKQNEKICVLDAPTLIENGLHKHMDFLVVVWVDKGTQLKRVMKRDNLNREDSIKRIEAQISLDKKKAMADFVIDNRFSLEKTEKQVENIFDTIYTT